MDELLWQGWFLRASPSCVGSGCSLQALAPYTGAVGLFTSIPHAATCSTHVQHDGLASAFYQLNAEM